MFSVSVVATLHAAIDIAVYVCVCVGLAHMARVAINHGRVEEMEERYQFAAHSRAL